MSTLKFAISVPDVRLRFVEEPPAAHMERPSAGVYVLAPAHLPDRDKTRHQIVIVQPDDPRLSDCRHLTDLMSLLVAGQATGLAVALRDGTEVADEVRRQAHRHGVPLLAIYPEPAKWMCLHRALTEDHHSRMQRTADLHSQLIEQLRHLGRAEGTQRIVSWLASVSDAEVTLTTARGTTVASAPQSAARATALARERIAELAAAGRGRSAALDLPDGRQMRLFTVGSTSPAPVLAVTCHSFSVEVSAALARVLDLLAARLALEEAERRQSRLQSGEHVVREAVFSLLMAGQVNAAKSAAVGLDPGTLDAGIARTFILKVPPPQRPAIVQQCHDEIGTKAVITPTGVATPAAHHPFADRARHDRACPPRCQRGDPGAASQPAAATYRPRPLRCALPLLARRSSMVRTAFTLAPWSSRPSSPLTSRARNGPEAPARTASTLAASVSLRRRPDGAPGTEAAGPSSAGAGLSAATAAFFATAFLTTAVFFADAGFSAAAFLAVAFPAARAAPFFAAVAGSAALGTAAAASVASPAAALFFAAAFLAVVFLAGSCFAAPAPPAVLFTVFFAARLRTGCAAAGSGSGLDTGSPTTGPPTAPTDASATPGAESGAGTVPVTSATTSHAPGAAAAPCPADGPPSRAVPDSAWRPCSTPTIASSWAMTAASSSSSCRRRSRTPGSLASSRAIVDPTPLSVPNVAPLATSTPVASSTRVPDTKSTS